MSDLNFYARQIQDELRNPDSSASLRLLARYESAGKEHRLEFVAALISALLVSEARRRVGPA